MSVIAGLARCQKRNPGGSGDGGDGGGITGLSADDWIPGGQPAMWR